MPNDSKAIGYPSNSLKTTSPSGKNFVLAIGIDAYTHCPTLHNAVKDAQDFVNLLTNRYNFDSTHIITLFDAEATSRKIIAKFRELAQRVHTTDNLIIYFSGHGEFDKIGKQGYWIPVNAERGELDDYLPNSTIRDWLNAITSHHTFLIADSCFSGTLFSSKDANRDIADRREIDPSRWGLTAGRNEIVDDGKPGTNSPFAEKLLDLLQKNDKPLGVAEICAKMMEIVQANADQTPRGEPLKIQGHEGGQFFFHPRNNEVEDWILLDKTSIPSLENFKTKHPLSNFNKEVDKTIEKLKKEQLDNEHTAIWERTQKRHSSDGYLSFYQQFLHSPYRAAAYKLMCECEDDENWQKTPRTKKGMLAYLDDHSKGRHEAEANAFLNPPKPQPTPEPVAPVVEKPKLETPIKTDTPVVEKPKPEPVKVTDTPKKVADIPPQYVHQNEPTFLEKYRLPLMGSAALLVAFMLWFILSPKKEPPNPNPQPPIETADETTAFSKAEKEHTIPNWEDFIKNYPNSARLKNANTALNTLKMELDSLIGTIGEMKTEKETLQSAKTDLEKAARIDPKHPEIIKLYKELMK